MSGSSGNSVVSANSLNVVMVDDSVEVNDLVDANVGVLEGSILVGKDEEGWTDVATVGPKDACDIVRPRVGEPPVDVGVTVGDDVGASEHPIHASSHPLR